MSSQQKTDKCDPPIVVPPVPGGNLTPLGVFIQSKQIKLDGQIITEVEYEQSEHGIASTGETQKRGSIYSTPRDAFSASNGCIYGYINTKISDDSQRMVIKFLGGPHGSSNPAAGRCYGVGLTLGDGTPVFEKEYPEHPSTPKFDDRVEFADEGLKELGNINGKTIGVQLLYWITPEKTMQGEFWVDISTLDKTLDQVVVAPNNWKKFFTFEDKGDLEGEVYTENQGIANNDDPLGLYFRINDEESTEYKFLGCTEIIV